jgi:hypothetical protein
MRTLTRVCILPAAVSAFHDAYNLHLVAERASAHGYGEKSPRSRVRS